jgi:hypothetical protein
MSRPARVLIALIALAVVGGSHAAFGATQLSKSGNPGPWSLRDTDAQPGGQCVYDADVPGAMGNDLDILSAVRTPRSLARDRTGGRDSQWVGGKVRFERSVNPGGTGGWVTARTAKLAKKRAFDDQAVTWGDRSWEVDTDVQYHFRITVLLKWFKPGSKTQVQGARQLLYQKYLTIDGVDEGVEDDRCLAEP